MAKRKRPNKATKDDSAAKAVTPDETFFEGSPVEETPVTEPDPADTVPQDKLVQDVTIEAADETEDKIEIDEKADVLIDSPEPEPEPEPEKEAAGPAPVAQAPAKSNALPLVFGGIVAAALGFIAAQADLFSRGSEDTSITDELRGELSTALERVATLEETLSNLPEPQPAPEPQVVDLTPLEEQIVSLQERVDLLSTTPAEDGTLPAAAFAAALADMRAETENTLADVRAATETQQAEIDGLLAEVQNAKADAEAAANAALARAALGQIMTALDSGADFGEAIDSLQAAGQADIPEALSAVAGDGVAQLAELQASIADAARGALDAARAAEDTNTVGAFFERRFGGRSIVPREGSDPDAVLSRVEAAVRAGDLETALSETAALPPEAQVALGSWLEQAQQRHEAVTAADALAQRLSAL